MSGSDGKSRQQRRHESRKGIREADIITAKPQPTALGLQAMRGDTRHPTDAAVWGGKLNLYTCERCRSHIVTRDVDEGVTPFMLPSKAYCPRRCGSGEAKSWVNMTSSFYRVWDQSMREDYQWYRPAPGDPIDRAYREHVDKGGLILRPYKVDDGIDHRTHGSDSAVDD